MCGNSHCKDRGWSELALRRLINEADNIAGFAAAAIVGRSQGGRGTTVDRCSCFYAPVEHPYRLRPVIV